MAEDSIRKLAAELGASTEALAALGAALRLRVSGLQAPPEVQQCLDEVVDALDARSFLESGSPEQLAALLSPINALLLQSVDLLSDPTRAPGWSRADVELLESQGRSSAVFAALIEQELGPRLEGLQAALSAPGAAFLDVGVGVGALAVAMCEAFPSLRVVGIDPWDFALGLARRKVEAAGLAARVELRRQAVQELADEDAFDLALLPLAFLPRGVLDVSLDRVLMATRRGGWALLEIYEGGSPLDTALARLRTARSGGAVLRADEAAGLLRAAGFLDVATLPGGGSAAGGLVWGRRPR